MKIETTLKYNHGDNDMQKPRVAYAAQARSVRVPDANDVRMTDFGTFVVKSVIRTDLNTAIKIVSV